MCSIISDEEVNKGDVSEKKEPAAAMASAALMTQKSPVTAILR